MDRLAERVASRYRRASDGPFKDYLDELPAAIELLAKVEAGYTEVERRLAEVQACLDAVVLGKELKKLQKNLAKLGSLVDVAREIGRGVTDLSAKFVREVDRSVAGAVETAEGHTYDWDRMKSEAGPVLGLCRKLDKMLSTLNDELPSDITIDELDSGIESRKFLPIKRLIEKLPTLDTISIFYDLGDALEGIDDALQEWIEDRLP